MGSRRAEGSGLEATSLRPAGLQKLDCACVFASGGRDTPSHAHRDAGTHTDTQSGTRTLPQTRVHSHARADTKAQSHTDTRTHKHVCSHTHAAVRAEAPPFVGSQRRRVQALPPARGSVA